MSAGLMDDAHSPTTALAPILGERWACSWRCVAVVAWFGLLFVLISHTPLALNGTWRHAHVGSWIITNGELPSTLPGVPLATGMPYLAKSWLFDVLVAEFARRVGANGISTLIALLVMVSLASWCGLYYRLSRNIGFVFMSAVTLGAIWSSHYGTLAPRLLANSLLAVLLWLVLPAWRFAASDQEDDSGVQNTKLAWWRWLSAALLFGLWSNLDVSFFLGLLMLLAITLGVLVSQLFAHGWRGMIGEPVIQWTWLLQLSAAATLLTPHGVDIWQYAATDGLNEVIEGVGDGLGLYLPSTSGVAVLLLLGLLAYLWTKGGRGFMAVETAVLLAAIIVTALDGSNVFWFAPVTLFMASCFLGKSGRHCGREGKRLGEGAAAWPDRVASTEGGDSHRPLKFAASLVCLLLIWSAFALSPVSTPVLGGAARPERNVFGTQIPREVAVTVQAKPTTQLVWAPRDWAEWLLSNEPTGIQVFANSRLRALPRQVRTDYSRVFRGESDWDRVLDRYAVGVLIVDKTRQSKLANSVMRNSKWKLVHETSKSLTLHRVRFDRGEAS